jgi:hypothetical protein
MRWSARNPNPSFPAFQRRQTEDKPGEGSLGGFAFWRENGSGGIGINPRFRDRVCGMFERLHPEKNIPGTGVGLAIVATAMDRLGGTYGVELNEPAGSRSRVELPK